MNQVPREVDKMTREFAQKMINMANDSLMAIRKEYVATEKEISHEAGYIEGVLAAVKAAGYAVTRDYNVKNSLYILK